MTEPIRKYALTDESVVHHDRKLYRIIALISFCDVNKNDKGGWIEGELNLDHAGNAWISNQARVFGDARVFDGARVFGDAQVHGNARVSGKAWMYTP